MKFRAWRRWVIGAGLAVLAVLLITLWYRQYSAENLVQEPIGARDVPRRDKSSATPPSGVPDRPSRDRGARP
jgi:hypothetical protein